MVHTFSKKALISIALVFIFIIITAILQHKNILNYFIAQNSLSQLDTECSKKKIIQDNGVYLIDKTPNGENIMLKVENRNEEAWQTSLLPVQSQSEQFSTCVREIQKYPKSLEKSAAWKELESRSKGLEVSIGIQKPFEYNPIANLILNIRLFSNRFSDDSYNLDLALQSISKDFRLQQESNNNLRLEFRPSLNVQNEKAVSFEYDFVELNGNEVNLDSAVNFISKDNGQTWTAVIDTNK